MTLGYSGLAFNLWYGEQSNLVVTMPVLILLQAIWGIPYGIMMARAGWKIDYDYPHFNAFMMVCFNFAFAPITLAQAWWNKFAQGSYVPATRP